MSLRYEQRRAVWMSRDFLRDLLDPKATPRVPRWIRQRAYRCLRHFPFLRDNGEPIWSQDPFSDEDDE